MGWVVSSPKHIFQQFLKAFGLSDSCSLSDTETLEEAMQEQGLDCNTGLKCLVSLMHTDVHVSPPISITKLCLGLIFAYQNLVTLLNQIHYIALTKWMLWPGRAWEALWVPRNHRQSLYMCLSTTQFYFPRRGPVIYIRLSGQLGTKKVEQPKNWRIFTLFPRRTFWNSVLLSFVILQISITELVRKPWSENNRKSD